MLRTLILTALATVLVFNLHAQAPSIQWQHLFGGSGIDNPGQLVSTGNGYLLSATTNSKDGLISGNHGKTDIWISMLDNSGNPLWSHCYGGSLNEGYGQNQNLLKTKDGNYIFAASTASTDGDITMNHGGSDGWIVKLAPDGSIIWQNTYGGLLTDEILAITEMADGGFVFVGESRSNDNGLSDHHGGTNYLDAWVGRIDKNGSLLWQKSIGGSGIDGATKVIVLTDGNLLITGASTSNDGDIPAHLGQSNFFDIFLMKLDPANGSIVWTKMIASTGIDDLRSVQNTNDGNVMISAVNGAPDGDFSVCQFPSDICIIKLDQNGNIIWKRPYGGSRDDEIISIEETTDGGMLMVGDSKSNDGTITQHYGDSTTTDIWIAKTFPSGGIQWQSIYGGSNYDYPSSIVASSTDFAILGLTNSTDHDLNGQTSYGNTDIWLFKFQDYSASINTIPSASDNVKLYPTLSHGSANIEFENYHKNIQFVIINSLGQSINSFIEKQSDKHYVINGLPIGLYIVRVAFDGCTKDFKMIVN